MPETRVQIAARAVVGVGWTLDGPAFRIAAVHAAAGVSAGAKAVTDRVREGLRKPHPLGTEERWRHCVCFICVDYRANLALLDQIDAELGGE